MELSARNRRSPPQHQRGRATEDRKWNRAGWRIGSENDRYLSFSISEEESTNSWCCPCVVEAAANGSFGPPPGSRGSGHEANLQTPAAVVWRGADSCRSQMCVHWAFTLSGSSCFLLQSSIVRAATGSLGALLNVMCALASPTSAGGPFRGRTSLFFLSIVSSSCSRRPLGVFLPFRYSKSPMKNQSRPSPRGWYDVPTMARIPDIARTHEA